MAELRFKGKDDKKMCVKLAVGMKPALVGRTGKVPILLPNSSVSRKHCEIREEKGSVRHRRSKERQWHARVNGEKLTKPRVWLTEIIFSVGKSRCILRSPERKGEGASFKPAGKKLRLRRKLLRGKLLRNPAKDAAKEKAEASARRRRGLVPRRKERKDSEAAPSPAPKKGKGTSGCASKKRPVPTPGQESSASSKEPGPTWKPSRQRTRNWRIEVCGIPCSWSL